MTVGGKKAQELKQHAREERFLNPANYKDKHILVFQDKAKDQYNCCISVMHYKPGWAQPSRVTRQDVHRLLASGAVAIHLDSPPTHFSALIRVECPNHTTRAAAGITLPNGTVSILSPEK